MQVEVVGFRSFEKNTLRGFAKLLVGGCVEISECPVHEKAGRRWIGFPARSYEKDSETKWQPLVRIEGDDKFKEFQAAAVKGLEKHLEPVVTSEPRDDDSIPF